MNAYEALADFANRFIECTVTIRFQPTPLKDGGNQTYYVLEILYPGPDKAWRIVKAGSHFIDIAAKDLFDAWNALEHNRNPI